MTESALTLTAAYADCLHLDAAGCGPASPQMREAWERLRRLALQRVQGGVVPDPADVSFALDREADSPPGLGDDGPPDAGDR
ncbi:hypothetical protein [uncultured Thiodictyon sp.]|uniref:hypothetical protein n=1 Tax=uncultured Thiodictyon sp. TaxID=1846217 RepID=UPI0025F63BA4|nr:hypothetical protein [uncultured Thiodictyon sp.]